MLHDLVLKNRSYRRFHETEVLSKELLLSLIDLARLSPSAKNMQSLRYIISNEKEKNNKIFPCLAWAGYLKDWDGPEEGERPSAYLVVLNDSSLSANFFCDDGIAMQSILLGAVEKGYGGCIFGSINKRQLRENLNIEEKYEILYVIALGKPKETVVVEDVQEDNDIKYWRDEDKIHHVPKRKLMDLIID